MSSYVNLSRIGCGYVDNPWDFYPMGPGTKFSYPDSVATSGKPTNVSPATASEVGQAFFADQCRLGGWTQLAQEIFETGFSQSYPNNFLPQRYGAGRYVSENHEYAFYNIGQIYLNNAFTWTFLRFPEAVLALVPFQRNDPDSIMVPVFTNKATAEAVGLNNVEGLLKRVDAADNKWGGLVLLAVNQALRAQNRLGPCGVALVYACTVLDREHAGWEKLNPTLAGWWAWAQPSVAAYRARSSLPGVNWGWCA